MPQRLVMELPAWSTWVDVDMFWECDVCFWKCSRVRNRLKQPGPEPSQDYFMKAYQSFVKLLERTGWQRLEFDHPLGTRPTHGKLTDGSRCGRHRPSNWRQFFADMDPHLEDILGVVPSRILWNHYMICAYIVFGMYIYIYVIICWFCAILGAKGESHIPQHSGVVMVLSSVQNVFPPPRTSKKF